jgi:hypothetical protein
MPNLPCPEREKEQHELMTPATLFALLLLLLAGCQAGRDQLVQVEAAAWGVSAKVCYANVQHDATEE